VNEEAMAHWGLSHQIKKKMKIARKCDFAVRYSYAVKINLL
jgi:hypothetical protein